MKYLLLLIAILLISCAGTQYKVDTSRLKNLDDFSEAKDLLAMNFSNFAKDSNRNVVNYATEYLEQANEIQAKLSTIDSNMVFNSVEETELLMLSMVSNARYYEPGGDIMIHGYPNKVPAFLFKFWHKWNDWTAGCIAVTNDEIEEIYDAVKDGTPITILP